MSRAARLQGGGVGGGEPAQHVGWRPVEDRVERLAVVVAGGADDRGVQQRRLGGEGHVDGGLRHAGLPSHRADARAGVPVAQEELLGGGTDPLPGGLGRGLAARGVVATLDRTSHDCLE